MRPPLYIFEANFKRQFNPENEATPLIGAL